VAHQAVGEGEQQAGGSASADEREGKVPAGSAAYAVVVEGRRQSAWKAMTVPVGRSLMMSQAQHRVLSTNGAGALVLPQAPCGSGGISSFMSWVDDSSAM